MKWRHDDESPTSHQQRPGVSEPRVAAHTTQRATTTTGADAQNCLEDISVTPEQEATARDLMQALWFARNAYAEAERVKRRCEDDLIEFLNEVSEAGIISSEHHFTVTRAVRRTAKVTDDQQFMAGLTEIGQVPKYKNQLDTNWLLKLADMYEGDFPGCEVTETPYLIVKGKQR